ncbi:Catabolite control protein A [Granulosicoccus antarcticus IMCC3135]|uniref:Catabolite control protein A n=2 Tax=Granulosicoccus TaxID=437504 RepID=A0A2Z2NZY1_9GAMM|nr:Catabolite control protein A [Granulosicoccus antarcticus IMCC3135]
MVSRAYTDGAKISNESRKKVYEAAEKLGYRVNYLARGLQTRQSNLVGIVASALDTPFRARQVKMAAREFIRQGYRPMLMVAETPDEVEQLISLLFSYNVAGMLITSATPSSEIIVESNNLSVPVVLINRETEIVGPDKVQIDIQQAGKLAFDMLIRSGAKNLAVVRPVSPSFSVTGRSDAFVQHCSENGYSAQVFNAASQSYDSGFEVAGKIGLALDRIDGLFCTTDLLAIGVMDRLRADWNVDIPNGLQIVGFDDIEQAKWGSYQLSTIRQDAKEQACAAVDLMLDRIENPDRDPKIYLQTVVPIFRNTTQKSQ